MRKSKPKRDKRYGLSKHVTKKQKGKVKKPRPKARKYNITKKKRSSVPLYQQVSVIRQPRKKRYSVQMPRQRAKQSFKRVSDSSAYSNIIELYPN